MIADSIVAFLVGVPLIYALVLLAQLPLLAVGQVPFSPHAWLVTPALGALVGTGISVVWNAKATFSVASERGSDGGRAALHQPFLAGVELQAPVAFLIAALFAAPAHNPAALVVIGALRGMVAAAVPAVITVFVDHKPVRWGWSVIVIVEVVIVIGGLAGLAGQGTAAQTLDLVLPAVVACALTYGLADLIATLRRARRTVPATGPDRPAPQQSPAPVQKPGWDRDRARSPGQRRRARRSKRRSRRRR